MEKCKGLEEMIEKGERLENKVAIVTGASFRGEVIGNGAATAITFARHGARVLLVDLDERNVTRTFDQINTEGGEAMVFLGDVSAQKDCEAMVVESIKCYGKLDILHNNVGIGGSGTVVDVNPDDWDEILAVNLKSMMLTGKYSVPAIASRGGGVIVNILSISAIRPRGLTSYTVSKAGVIALTKAMAVDHAGDGIRVNCILPGPVYSSMTAGAMSEERREIRRKSSPLGIEGTPWDIAMAALYLASSEARWVTGVILNVDGGVTLLSPQR